MKKIISGLLLLTLCSCGGGSSDGSSPRNVSGQWTGAITKVSDTCTNGAAQRNISHAVSQNQGAVELTDALGIKYLGNVVGEDGFSVDGSDDISSNCSDNVRIEYNDVNEDDDSTASVNVKIVRTCPNTTNTCQIEYTGTAARAGSPSPTVTPSGTPSGTVTPSTTPAPVAGGCAAMNPNPASGEYSGDGGCGISSAKLTVNQGNPSSVILEPFGANGATSFTILQSGSSVANSSRNDLTILNTPGYSCTLTCSPPGTFNASCFKEGGTTCVEKF